MKINHIGHHVANIRLQRGSLELAPYAHPVQWEMSELNGFPYITLIPSSMKDAFVQRNTGISFFGNMFSGPLVEIPSEYVMHAGFERNQQATVVRWQDHVELWRAKRYQYVLEQISGMPVEDSTYSTAHISRNWLFLPPNFYKKWGEDKLVIIPYGGPQHGTLLVLPFEIYRHLPRMASDCVFERLCFSRGREARPHLGGIKLSDDELEHLGNLTHEEVYLLYTSNKVQVSKASLEARVENLVDVKNYQS